MNKLLYIVVIACIIVLQCKAEETDLVSRVSAMAEALYDNGSDSPAVCFGSVRGGGMNREMARDEYMPFVSFVSNNCAAIAADWQSYETNEVVEFGLFSSLVVRGQHKFLQLEDNTNDTQPIRNRCGRPCGAELRRSGHEQHHYADTGACGDGRRHECCLGVRLSPLGS